MNSIFSHGTTIKESIQTHKHPDFGVGHSRKKIDALEKLLGRTRYTDDISLPGMLFGKIVRSPHAHARIISIDTSSILDMPGVVDVIIGADMPIKYGVIPWTKDEYPLAVGKTRYVGDAVAAVIAHSESIAYEAGLKLKVEYEVLPSILTIAQAKVTDALQVNERAKIGNITKHVDLSFGSVEENLAQADVVMKENFSFHNTTHAPIEPHCAIGNCDTNGRLTVYSSTQVPHYLHRTLSEVLDVPAHQIRVIQPPLGGAFGGKSEPFDLEFVVALASMRLKKPVKILYTREEVFFAHRGRHPMDITMTMGVKNNGEIIALKNNIEIDGGAYASFGMITAFYAGQLLCGPVGMKSYQFSSTRYYTNKPACGPKRGHGSVQPRFAFEIMCDMAAEKLNMDPIQFRLINAVSPESTTVNGQQVGSLGLEEVLSEVAHASQWTERKKFSYGRGLGVACSMYISGTNYPVYPNDMPQSSVSIRFDRCGALHIFSGASDIGQGAATVLAQIAQEELGINGDRICVTTADTDLTPVDLGAYSSRVTMMMGHAAMEAFRKARHKISQAVAKKLGERFSKEIDDSDLVFSNERIFLKDAPEISMSFNDALVYSESLFGSLVFSGDYRTVERGGDYRGGSIGASPAYSCTAHIADVSVDTNTGKISINKIYVAHDCGRAINPLLVEGQIEGSTYMGAAEVVLEQFIVDEEEGARKGMLIGPSLLDYRIPTTLDTPPIHSIIVEKPDKNGPYGAKEAGEGPLHSAIPAVANAIYAAVGVRLTSLPFSPARILDALKKKGEPCCP
ncbi:MAG: molybdopterin-dependent oxidoreductase [Myxococcales bacterium]|nr:molybdopterin-dependent oxidoreductase [Myxococcales bacterium]USN50187.1 MAG: molybdopterin-dependent oxidoreductase [Myxococcales bacterium]